MSFTETTASLIARCKKIAWSFVARFMRQPVLEAVPEPVVEQIVEAAPALPAPVVVKQKRQKKPSSEANEYRFHFRDQILDRLPEHFTYAKRMKRFDPESYGLYSRVGAALKPKSELPEELSAWWRAGNRPTFGCGSTAGNIDMDRIGDNWPMRFGYFQRLWKPRAGVILQPVPRGSLMYEVTVYWDRVVERKIADSGYGMVFRVLIDESANITLLKEHYTRIENGIPIRAWAYSPGVLHAAAFNKVKPEIMARHIFADIALAQEAIESGILVRVKRDGITASFAIDGERASYFFADREFTANKAGSRRPIFHAVRAHSRVTGSGTTYVRNHFRGEREFDWNGYHVFVSVPGLHHKPLTWLQGDSSKLREEDGAMALPEAGRLLDIHMGADQKLADVRAAPTHH